MKPLTIVLVAFLLLTTTAAYAQPVQSMPYTGTPAGTSSAPVLWSQLDEPSGSAFTDQAFEAAYAAYDADGAEDFVVTAYEWHLDSIFTPGSVTVPGSNPFFVNTLFYEDAGGLPGAVIYGCDFTANTNFSSAGDGDLTVDVQGNCVIQAQNAWFSQSVRMDFNPLGQHYWATRSTAAGTYPGLWKNPGNGFGNGCLDWQPANAVCGMTGEDWMFELSGWQAEPPETPAIGPFGVVLLVLALGGGTAYVLRRRRG